VDPLPLQDQHRFTGRIDESDRFLIKAIFLQQTRFYISTSNSIPLYTPQLQRVNPTISSTKMFRRMFRTENQADFRFSLVLRFITCLQEEASSPDGEAFEQLPTRDPPPGRFGVRQLGESAEGQSAGGTEPSWEGIGLGGIGRSCGSLQGGRGPGGGPEGPPAGGGKRRRTDAATLSWQAGSLDSIPGGAHCGDSVGDQLAASKQLLREEESFDGVSNGESNASVTEGGLPEVPRRRHGGGLGLLESSGLGDGIGGLEESLGEELGGFGGGHNSEKEISGGESAEGYPLGLRGSPTVEEELGGLRRVRRQGSSVSVGVWGGSRGPSLEHHFGGEDSVLGPEGWQCLGGGGVDEVSGGALSALDDSR